MNLTEKAIAKLVPGKKRLHVYDEDVTGFGLRVEVNGRKSFFWFAKVNGKPRFRALGEYPAVTVSTAREAARTLAGQASAWKLSGFAGPDPFEKEKRAEPASVPTFQKLLDAYVERHVRETANSPERAEYMAKWMAKKYFSDWTERPIDTITLADVVAVKNACGKKKYAANRAVEFIRALFNWSAGEKDGKVQFWPVANPAASVSTYPETRRIRFLQPEELLRFNAALEKEPSADLRDFLTLAMSTGARKSEIFAMRWEDVRWEQVIWHIPHTKNGEPRDVSLLPAALETLKRRRASAPDSDVYVFPGVGDSGHLVDLKARWNEFRKRAELPGFRLHDVRHTHASYQAIAGVSLQTIGAALGHRSLQSTQVYAHLHQQAVREGREAGEAKMLAMMNEAKKRAKRAKVLPARKPKLLKSV